MKSLPEWKLTCIRCNKVKLVAFLASWGSVDCTCSNPKIRVRQAVFMVGY